MASSLHRARKNIDQHRQLLDEVEALALRFDLADQVASYRSIKYVPKLAEEIRLKQHAILIDILRTINASLTLQSAPQQDIPDIPHAGSSRRKPAIQKEPHANENDSQSE